MSGRGPLCVSSVSHNRVTVPAPVMPVPQDQAHDLTHETEYA
jgi:hypothetical protein